MSDAVETWMRALAKGLHNLPHAAQDDIMAEVRAHVADRLSQGMTVEQTLAGFGDAKAFARKFGDDTRLDDAMAQRYAAEALVELLTVAARAFTAGFGLVAGTLSLLLVVRIAGLFLERLGLMSAIDAPLDPAALLSGLGLWMWPAGVIIAFILGLAARTSFKLAVASLRMERFA